MNHRVWNVLIVALIGAVLLAVGIVIGLNTAPSHPFARQNFSTFWFGVLASITATGIVALIVLTQRTVPRRLRNWWVSRTEANRQKEIKRLEERRTLVTNLHANPVVYTRYVLKQLMDCVYFLGAAFFLGIGVAMINKLLPVAMNVSNLFLFEMQAISIIMLFLSLFLMHRMLSIAVPVTGVIQDVEKHEAFLENTQRQIRSLSRATGTRVVVDPNVVVTLHKTSGTTEGVAVVPNSATPSTDDEEGNRS